MASKSKRSVAPYVALLVAALILVPELREPAFNLLEPLVDLVKDAFSADR